MFLPKSQLFGSFLHWNFLSPKQVHFLHFSYQVSPGIQSEKINKCTFCHIIFLPVTFPNIINVRRIQNGRRWTNLKCRCAPFNFNSYYQNVRAIKIKTKFKFLAQHDYADHIRRFFSSPNNFWSFVNEQRASFGATH